MSEETTTIEPQRARPVFSSEDFSLLRTAVAAYVKQIQDSPESSKYVHLHHRLGRMG